MPDPEPSIEITVIIDRPCWENSTAHWESLLQPAVLKTLHQLNWGHSSEINILLTDNAVIQSLNKSYRDQNKPTNVLAFPSLNPDEIAALYKNKPEQSPIILGDVVLAFETIQQESNEQKKDFEKHLVHLTVHGTLHLLGFDHEKDDDAATMESLEIKILSSLMIPNPYEE
jgi:probable rRNA maturation factor